MMEDTGSVHFVYMKGGDNDNNSSRTVKNN